MTFYQWLMTQRDRDDPIGDLANDAERDDQAKQLMVDATATLDYLWSRNACHEAREAADQAWREWSVMKARTRRRTRLIPC